MKLGDRWDELAHSHDEPELRAGASSVGGAMYSGDLELMKDFQGTLLKLQGSRKEDDSYVRGFREALIWALDQYMFCVEDEKRNAGAAALVRKEGWRQILALVEQKSLRPSEIATALGLDPSTVSRTLADMREAGLVEQYPPPEGGDKRSRPQFISSLGLHALEKLGPSVPPAFDTAFDLAAAVFARLATDRRISERSCTELAQQVLREPGIDHAGAARKLLEAATRRNLVVKQDDALVGADLTTQGAVYRLLIDAVGNDRAPTFLEQVAEKLPQETQLVVRSARANDLWNIYFKRVPNRFGSRTLVVDREDLLVGAVEPPPGKYALLYDSATLLRDDHNVDLAGMRALEKKASRRLCLTPNSPVTIDPGYEAIPVAA